MLAGIESFSLSYSQKDLFLRKAYSKFQDQPSLNFWNKTLGREVGKFTAISTKPRSLLLLPFFLLLPVFPLLPLFLLILLLHLLLNRPLSPKRELL